MTAPMPETMSPREKVAVFETCPGCGADEPRNRCLGCCHDFAPINRQTSLDSSPKTALASSGDHAELADTLSSPFNACCYRDRCLALIAENAALRAERDQIAGESIWWTGVIGDGSHQPSGEVRSIKHLHPAMVKPIYEANKGTAVADVIAGLIFSLAITENREQFLVADANERRTEAERKLAEAEAEVQRWKSAHDIAHEQATENGSAANAIRGKLAEAVGLLRDAIAEHSHMTDVEAFEELGNVAATELIAVRTFLSKEAERG